MKRDVFISYSRKNIERVKEIKSQIDSQCGTDCWVDLNGIESGSERFEKDIIGGINNCQVFLFMLSNESQQSEYALLELNFAKKKGKRIVIINIDDCQMCDAFEFKYSLTDTIAWNNQPQREKLLRDVSRWIGSDQSTPTQSHNPKDSLQIMHENIVQSAKEMRKIYQGRYISLAKWNNGILSVGTVTIPGRWEEATYVFYGDVMRIKSIDGLYGLVDAKGRLVIPAIWPKMDDERFYGEGLIPVMDNSKEMWGYANVIGGTIQCQWKYAGKFNEGLAPVENFNGKNGYIDKKGNLVIPYQWKQACMFSSNLAFVQDDKGKWGCINHDGRLVVPCVWKDFRANFGFCVKGHGVVQDDSGLWGMIDKSGRVVIPCQWTKVGFPLGFRTPITDQFNRCGFLDSISGEIVIPCTWADAKDFSNGIAEVKDDNGKWWRIDPTGKVVGAV